MQDGIRGALRGLIAIYLGLAGCNPEDLGGSESTSSFDGSGTTTTTDATSTSGADSASTDTSSSALSPDPSGASTGAETSPTDSTGVVLEGTSVVDTMLTLDPSTEGPGPLPDPSGETSGSETSPETGTPDPFDSATYHAARALGTTEAGVGYWEFLPPTYGGEPLPLLVALHGIDENGAGTADTLPAVLANGPARLIARNEWPLERPFVVLSPQFDGTACPDPRWVANFIEFGITQYLVDPSRVYLTGLSCGAYGVWNYLGTFGGARVAAAVPIAGNGTGAWNQAGCELAEIPIWAFHGDSDERVPTTGTTDVVANLQLCAPPPVDLRMTIYLGTSHNSWARTYDLSAGHDIYDWMLSHTL